VLKASSINSSVSTELGSWYIGLLRYVCALHIRRAVKSDMADCVQTAVTRSRLRATHGLDAVSIIHIGPVRPTLQASACAVYGCCYDYLMASVGGVRPGSLP